MREIKTKAKSAIRRKDGIVELIDDITVESIPPIQDGDITGIEDITLTTPPADQCIYCGETVGIFTDEHVVPHFLKGTECIPCEDTRHYPRTENILESHRLA